MEEIVYNRVLSDGMCEVKLVADHELTRARMLRFVTCPCLDYAVVNCYSTAALSLFYGEVTYPLRGALELCCEGWIKPKRFGVWRLMKDDGFSVSQIIEWMANWYFVQTHRKPSYAFLKKLPKEAVSGQLLADSDVMLMEAEWALDKCVMVGG